MNTNESIDNQQVLSFRELSRALFEHSVGMLLVFASTISLTILLVFVLLTPKFEAKASLIVNNTDLLRPLVEPVPQSDFEKIIEFQTQTDVLSSVRLAGEVVAVLDLGQTRQIGNVEKLRIRYSRLKNWIGGLLDLESWTRPWDPEAASMLAISNNLIVETAPQSKTIKLSYRSHDPDEAAATLETLVNRYQSYYYEQSTIEADGVLTYLQARIRSAEKELIEAENAILEFRQDRDTRLANEGGDRAYSTVGITDSLEVQDEFKLYILRLEEELRLLSQDLPENDPRIVTLEDKLATFVRAVNELPGDELELQRLKRQHTLAQDKYLLLAQNLEQARLIAMGQTNSLGLISILEEPEADPSPVSPKRKLILVLSLFLAASLSLAFAYVSRFFDTSIRNPEDLRGVGELRHLGSLKRVRPS